MIQVNMRPKRLDGRYSFFDAVNLAVGTVLIHSETGEVFIVARAVFSSVENPSIGTDRGLFNLESGILTFGAPLSGLFDIVNEPVQLSP